LKRRKKTSEAVSGQDALAPLQPAYFASANPGDMPVPKSAETEPAGGATEPAAPPPLGEDSAEAASSFRTEQPSQGRPSRRRRRRRGRGGRGSGRDATRDLPLPQQTPVHAEPEEASSAMTGASEETSPRKVLPPPPAQMTDQRPPKGVVVLAIGLPGSGKSSWFKRHNIMPLSSDMLRMLLFDDATEQRYQDLIFSNLRSLLKTRLIAHRPTNYVDATNLTPHERHSWIKLAKDFGYEVQAVFFDVPVEVCLERNQRRHRAVPDDVMHRMASKLRPPTFEEGFAKITVVRVKQRQ
jgi:predicted kinase